MVAAACHTLCEAANGLVQGHATEERLISSAKQVASSTAALLVACKVKADLTSQAMKRLQHAGLKSDFQIVQILIQKHIYIYFNYSKR